MAKKKKRKIIATITTIAMILGSLIIPSGMVSEAASKTLKVTCKKTVAVNCTTTIKTNVKAKFKSSNKKIATVSSKGVVKGKKAGKVKITVTSKSNKKQEKTVTITVKNQLVINAPTDSKATLYVGESTKIKTNLSSKFKSSDISVATVSSSGKVVAKKAGTAKITVTSKSNKKLKKTVTITVKNKPEATTEATTEKPNTNVTPDPAPGSTTEDTTDKPTTEDPTTTEQETTEQPSTEEPTEPEIVGITAKYRGDKVPNGSSIIIYGIDLKAIYSDGTEKDIILNYKTDEISLEYVEEIVNDGKNYAKYNVYYEGYSEPVSMEVELIDVGDTIYPTDLGVYYSEGIKIKKGEMPKEEYISTVRIYMSNGTTQDFDDISNLKYYLYNDFYSEDDETWRYEFDAIYDYWLEYNGEKLYICLWDSLYIDYE